MLQKIFLKTTFALSVLTGMFLSFPAHADVIKKQETGFFKDAYDQNVHGEVVNQFDLGRQTRRLFHKPLRSLNVNLFDEVPDSAFFENRHARTALTKEKLVQGPFDGVGPDISGDLIVTSGKTDGLHPKYYVRDSRGDNYLLKFDATENLELSTSAEAIASRFYYALGYNVPQYTIVIIPANKLKAGEGAKLRDDTGFLKALTQEELDEQLLFSSQVVGGGYRVSASKILTGESKGYFSFDSRRKNDPEDLINHRDRREIRALRVFAAWLNNTDVSESNTLDMQVTENGKTFLKHYLIDFNSALGSDHHGAKAPVYGHEYFVDFGETLKAFFTLGFWEKPWQKRWREAGEKANASPAIGYFDNHEFYPKGYKTQLPYEAFKRLTRADGFWAVKQIMAFSDEDVRSIVSAGQLTQQADAEYIVKTLIERRNLIAKYWFANTNPLDGFKIENGKLLFKDLAVQAGFEKVESRNYSATVLDQKGRAVQTLASSAPEFPVDVNSAAEEFEIRALQSNRSGPFVRVKTASGNVLSISHQD